MTVALVAAITEAIIALAALALLAIGIIRRRWALIAGPAAALAALVALFPASCDSTAIGIPEGGPDPNAASCSTAVFHTLGAVEPNQPETNREFTSIDVVRRRMAAQAVTAAALPLLAGAAGAVLQARRERGVNQSGVSEERG